MLRIRDIRAGYGLIEILHGVSLDVPSGALGVVIGGNGAGKSTVLLTVCGVLTPRSGQVLFDGTDITGWPADRVARAGLVLVPQGRRVLAPMSVEENLMLGGYRLSQTRVRARLDELYAKFPLLSERRRQLAGLMSGGEQAILVLARALMSDPRMLLMDEPSVGLSPKAAAGLFDAVAALVRDKLPVLMVEQNARRALAVADLAFLMRMGEIVRAGPARGMLRDPEVERVYLGYA